MANTNHQRHAFLADFFFFGETRDFSERRIVSPAGSEWVLVRHRNGNTGGHEVAIYPAAHYLSGEGRHGK